MLLRLPSADVIIFPAPQSTYKTLTFLTPISIASTYGNLAALIEY